MKHAYFQANAALMAAAFVSTEATRYYLNGVYVHPVETGGVNIVATDGHRMLIVHDKHGFASEGMIVRIPTKKLTEKSIWKAITTHRMIVVRVDDTGSRIDVIDAPLAKPDAEPGKEEAPFDLMAEVGKLASPFFVASATDVVIDGTFPDYQRVVPEVKLAKKGMPPVNPKYLKDFIMKFNVLDDGWFEPTTTPPTFQMQANDPLSPAQVIFNGGLGGYVFGVIMPMRVNDDNVGVTKSAPGFIRKLFGWNEPASAPVAPPKTVEPTNPLANVTPIRPAAEPATGDATPQPRKRHRLPTATAA